MDGRNAQITLPILSFNELMHALRTQQEIKVEEYRYLSLGKEIKDDDTLKQVYRSWDPWDEADVLRLIQKGPSLPMSNIVEEQLYARHLNGSGFPSLRVDEIPSSSVFFGNKPFQEFVDRLYEELLFTTKKLQDHQIPYTIACGTLLGAYRNGGLIPNDDDIDLNIPEDSKEAFIALTKEFSEQGYEIFYHWEGWYKIRKIEENGKKLSNGIDVFFMCPFVEQTELHSMIWLDMEEDAQKVFGKAKWKIPANTFSNLIDIPFGHIMVKAINPKDAFSYFNRVYGSNWATKTKKHWDHIQDIPTVSETQPLEENDYFYLRHSAHKRELQNPLFPLHLEPYKFWISHHRKVNEQFHPMTLEDITELKTNKVITEAESEQLINFAFDTFHPLIFLPSDMPITRGDYSINLLWIHKEETNFSAYGNLVSERSQEDVGLMTRAFYEIVLRPLLDWNLKNPDATLNFWYDGKQLGPNKEAIIENSYSLIKKIEKLKSNPITFKDIRDLKDIRDYPNILDEKKLFWIIDFAKVLITDDQLELYPYTVVADLDIMPIAHEHLFDKYTLEELDEGPGYQCARMTAKGIEENSFLIFSRRAKELHREVVIENIIKHFLNDPKLCLFNEDQGVFVYYLGLFEHLKKHLGPSRFFGVTKKCGGKGIVTYPSQFHKGEQRLYNGYRDEEIKAFYKFTGLR